MNKRITLFLVIILVLNIADHLTAQNVKVRIAPTAQKYINGVSTLDRNKYFGLHGTEQDARLAEFAEKYGLVLGGRGFWGPHAFSKHSKNLPIGEYPTVYDGPDHPGFKIPVYQSGDNARMISVQHPVDVVKIDLDVEAAANYAAEWFLNTDYTKDALRPKYFELMNEPFVKANDEAFRDQPGFTQDRMVAKMVEAYKAVGKRFSEIPELDNMKIIGFSDAWVSYEVNNFAVWNGRMKFFMDEAGEYMDAFAIHIYDGINVVGTDSRRSGSNSEAVLDMVESYSTIKWDVIKPHAITEFGGIERGYGPQYSELRASQALRSFNHMVFNFMDRTKDMEVALPFIGTYSDWTIVNGRNNARFVNSIFVPEPLGVPKDQTDNYEWVYGPQAYYYILWQNVKGDRVVIDSDNPDIQVQAFVDGNQLFVALNNLDDFDREVDLDMIDNNRNLTNLTVRRLKVYDREVFEYDETDLTEAMETVSLLPDETVILEYTFDESITFDNKLENTKYYSSNFLKIINRDAPLRYDFNRVDVGENGGFANLRMSIARKHADSKKPSIKVNDAPVSVPTNWEGYDQASRDDFFGMISIPIPHELIQTKNKIEIEFSDAGGHVSSAILEVQNFESTPSAKLNGPEVITSISYQDQAEGFKVIPTVVENGQFKVQFNSARNFSLLRVHSLEGREVYRQQLTQNERGEISVNNMAGFSKGTYILTLYGSSGRDYSKLIIK